MDTTTTTVDPVAIPVPEHLDIDDLIAVADEATLVVARQHAGGPAYEWANGMLAGLRICPPSRLELVDKAHAIAAVAGLTESQYARLKELAGGEPSDPAARIAECRHSLHHGGGAAA